MNSVEVEIDLTSTANRVEVPAREVVLPLGREAAVHGVRVYARDASGTARTQAIKVQHAARGYAPQDFAAAKSLSAAAPHCQISGEELAGVELIVLVPAAADAGVRARVCLVGTP